MEATFNSENDVHYLKSKEHFPAIRYALWTDEESSLIVIAEFSRYDIFLYFTMDYMVKSGNGDNAEKFNPRARELCPNPLMLNSIVVLTRCDFHKQLQNEKMSVGGGRYIAFWVHERQKKKNVEKISFHANKNLIYKLENFR